MKIDCPGWAGFSLPTTGESGPSSRGARFEKWRAIKMHGVHYIVRGPTSLTRLMLPNEPTLSLRTQRARHVLYYYAFRRDVPKIISVKGRSLSSLPSLFPPFTCGGITLLLLLLVSRSCAMIKITPLGKDTARAVGHSPLPRALARDSRTDVFFPRGKKLTSP